MKIQFKNLYILLVVMILSTTSCFNDLEVLPIDDDFNTSEVIYRDPASYKQVLAKLYAGLAVTGQQGPAGQSDLARVDEGFTSYLRGLWNVQELTTEEAINAWVNDIGMRDLHDLDYDANNQFVEGMYYRIYYQVPLANEFLRETTDERMNSRGISSDVQNEVRQYRSEVRFLRALSYWHALDMFRNAPFIPEDAGVGAESPSQYSPQQMFDYIEGELLAIENELIPAGQNEYARADQAAAWMLLAKLYMNAEVYIGQAKYTECITYCNKIINSNAFSLEPVYEHLFLADNHNSNEIIFPVAFDGVNTQTWGGMTFIINSSNGGDMNPMDRGVNGAWSGNRTTGGLVDKFIAGQYADTTDARMLFFSEGANYEVENVFAFTDGWGVTKFSNITSTGVMGADNTHPDTDFPMFRLADVYLMYAEAVKMGGTGGDEATAVNYVNMVRQRAGVSSISASDLTTDFILDERARELYWECHRRTDLVRHGLLTSSTYVWPWKGEVKEGVGVDEKYNILPIPAFDIAVNTNLLQNPGF